MPLWGPSNGSEEVRLGEVPKEAMHSINIAVNMLQTCEQMKKAIVPMKHINVLLKRI